MQGRSTCACRACWTSCQPSPCASPTPTCAPCSAPRGARLPAGGGATRSEPRCEAQEPPRCPGPPCTRCLRANLALAMQPVCGAPGSVAACRVLGARLEIAGGCSLLLVLRVLSRGGWTDVSLLSCMLAWEVDPLMTRPVSAIMPPISTHTACCSLHLATLQKSRYWKGHAM